MTTSGWPFPSVTDAAWLTPPGQDDPFLSTSRDAVRALLPTADGPATPDHVLQALTTAQELADRIDWVLLSLVGEARGLGLSWERVAGALGVSKQAAHKRFGPYVAEALAQVSVPVQRAPEPDVSLRRPPDGALPEA